MQETKEGKFIELVKCRPLPFALGVGLMFFGAAMTASLVVMLGNDSVLKEISQSVELQNISYGSALWRAFAFNALLMFMTLSGVMSKGFVWLSAMAFVIKGATMSFGAMQLVLEYGIKGGVYAMLVLCCSVFGVTGLFASFGLNLFDNKKQADKTRKNRLCEAEKAIYRTALLFFMSAFSEGLGITFILNLLI